MTTLTEIVQARFGGVIYAGKHAPDGKACIVEAASVARGSEWSDEPEHAQLPDMRPINDGRWPTAKARTAAMLPMAEALWGWPDWSDEHKQAWISRVMERTIREILPIALRAVGLSAEADRCEQEGTESAARVAHDAARVADDAARALGCYGGIVADAASCARLAISAGYYPGFRAVHAAMAARNAAKVAGCARVLVLACRIWQEEAER